MFIARFAKICLLHDSLKNIFIKRILDLDSEPQA